MNTYRVEIWNPNFKRPFGLQSPHAFQLKYRHGAHKILRNKVDSPKSLRMLWDSVLLEKSMNWGMNTFSSLQHSIQASVLSTKNMWQFYPTTEWKKKKNPCSRNRISKCITISCTTCFPLPSRGLSYTVWYFYVMDTSPKSFFQMFR